MARDLASIIQVFQDDITAYNSGEYAGRIAYEGAEFTKPTSGLWVRPKVLFASPELIGAFADQGQYREQGIFQISVFSPNGSGSIAVSRAADALLGHYERGSQLTGHGITVKIEKSYRRSAIEEASWIQVPVSCEFWCYTPYRS